MKTRSSRRWFGLLAAALLWSGCNHFLARQLVSPPNAIRQSDAPVSLTLAKDKLTVPVGPPGASLAAWIVNPPNHAAPRGTVLVVHGFLADHTYLRYAQDGFSKAGYRVIMVDLRGHGESTGKHVTFGAVESHDLSQLLDALASKDLLAGPVGAYGVSLGAATVIDFAAHDSRVAAVIAVSSFDSLEAEIPHYARTMLPFPGRFLSTADFTFILERAQEIAGFQLVDASPLHNISSIHVPILLFHGRHDAIVPVAAGEALHAANPEHSELHLLSEGHNAACFDLSGEIMKTAVPWLAAHLHG